MLYLVSVYLCVGVKISMSFFIFLAVNLLMHPIQLSDFEVKDHKVENKNGEPLLSPCTTDLVVFLVSCLMSIPFLFCFKNTEFRDMNE